jgi:hypothetical protein
VKPYSGKYLWIWNLNQCGDPAVVVETATRLGCSGIAIKAWDGADSENWLPQLQQIVPAAHDVGLLVAAWGYSYGSLITGEVAAMVEAVSSGHADWLIIDAESEYEQSYGAQMGAELLDQLAESSISYATFGLTTFALPVLHPEFPYSTFAQHVQVMIPQVYWADAGYAPDVMLEESLAQLSKYGLPVAPIGQAYGTATPAQIATFGKVAAGQPGISFWSLDSATVEMLEAIRAIAGLASRKRG